MADDSLSSDPAQALMLREQAPTLKEIEGRFTALCDQVIARYHNPALRHHCSRLRWMAARNFRSICWTPFASILLIIAIFDLLALGVAGWMRYVGGVDEA